MIFAGIIWGPAVQFKDGIDDVCKKYSTPLFACDVQLNEHYDQFVYDIYNEEDTPKWKIHKKVEHMQNLEDKKVRVVFFDIDTSETFYHDRKKCDVFANVENMKGEVRNTYKDQIEDYFFDIVFHLTDNHKELTYTASVLKDYLAKVPQEGKNVSFATSLISDFERFDVPKLYDQVGDFLGVGALQDCM